MVPTVHILFQLVVASTVFVIKLLFRLDFISPGLIIYLSVFCIHGGKEICIQMGEEGEKENEKQLLTSVILSKCNVITSVLVTYNLDWLHEVSQAVTSGLCEDIKQLLISQIRCCSALDAKMNNQLNE